MLTGICEDAFTDLFTASASQLVICAANFEDRSTELVRLLEEKNAISRKTLLRNLYLKSEVHAAGVLDLIKERNTNQIQLLNSGLGNYERINLAYPDRYSDRQVHSNLEGWLSSLSQEGTIVVDVSCLPRPIVMDIAHFFLEHHSVLHDYGHRLFVAYTTPASYPLTRSPYNPGVVKTFRRGITLSQAVQERGSITAMIFPGGQGFEGKVVLDELQHLSVDKHLFIYLSQQDLVASFDLLRSNSALLREENLQYHFYFDLNHGSRLLRSTAMRVAETDDYPSILFGPFGPKIHAWTAMELVWNLSRQGVWADVASLFGVQYTSVYSIGAAKVHFFRFEPPPSRGDDS